MFLKKIELRGFKSFAEKTTIDFPSQQHGHVITGIVGPNGSGKSNISDAIRWVLGEQSIKMLRGKKSQDVIFAGTDKKARLSSAEVLLHLDNTNGSADIDMSEIAIGRRLYRSGESEYLIGNAISRLQDVNLLLARAHFGQRTYSIIGQGMVDSFVTASPTERQELLEEAAGVKEYQLKKHESLNKLIASIRNLEQVETLLSEIGPRLRSLTRQVKRLERKEELVKELKKYQVTYYGGRWKLWNNELETHKEKESKDEARVSALKKEVDELQKTWQKTALAESVSSSFQKLQGEYEKILSERNKLYKEEFAIKNEMLVSERKTTKESVFAEPLFVEKIKQFVKNVSDLFTKLSSVKTIEEFNALSTNIETLRGVNREMLKKLEGVEEKNNGVAFKEKLKSIEEKHKKFEAELLENQKKVGALKKEEEEKNKTIITLQQKLQEKQNDLNVSSGSLNSLKIERARLEAKLEDLLGEAKQEEVGLEDIKIWSGNEKVNEEILRGEIGKLKHQLELIGGIDEETMKEYGSTKERFEFLSKEVKDSRDAIKGLEKIIIELERKIEHQFNASFSNVAALFQKYFKILFGGGNAHLKKLPRIEEEDKKTEDVEDDDEVEEKVADDAAALEVKKRLGRYMKSGLSGGIEITATPPGKKLTSITMLSGGEKALTAIALICAIIANRPSPFVVLDEVDAALDEANSERFAKILTDLSNKTQFIVITHNRATMHQAKILYGITMGSDGVSKLLSVNLEEAVKQSE